MRFPRLLLLLAAIAASACAGLSQLTSIVQPPRFEQAEGQPAEIRILGPSRTLAVGGRVSYELNGTVGVDAGRLGTPTFGPMLMTRGELRVVR